MDQSSAGCICNETLFITIAIDSEYNVLLILRDIQTHVLVSSLSF